MQIFIKTFTDKTPYLRLAGGSHDKFLPCMTTLRLARELSASHENFPPCLR
jgi:hypothetical protein